MTMPTWQDILLPFLQTIQEGTKTQLRSVTEVMIAHFDLTEDEREVREKNGQRKIHNNVSWASTHLAKANLISRPTRGFVKISDEGLALLATSPDTISMKTLDKYPAYAEWRASSRRNPKSSVPNETEDNETYEQNLNPVAVLENSARLLNEQLAEELLIAILERPPEFFEQLIIDVMKAMEYGSGEHVGRSGDGGIDGVIDEDRLGLDKIYLQAKRQSSNNKVSSPAIRGFIGSMASHGATKGVFVTTSEFTKSAIEEARKNLQFRVVLIDGQELARLMIDYDVGVSEQTTWTLKRLDSDYFNPDG